MGLEPDARLVVNRELDLRGLPLTPIDFFLFSRVEMLGGASPPTVSDVIAASGQPRESAEQALLKLMELGALSTAKPRARPRAEPDAARPRAIAERDEADLRRRARERKKGLLAAQMRVARAGAAPSTRPSDSAGSGDEEASPAGASGPADEDEDEEPSLPTARAEPPFRPPSGRRPVVVRSILDQIEPVAEDDPRLDPEIGVPLARQRRLLAVRERLRHVGHFEMLGLEPVDDARVIRRAYHVVSRELHPDSYYGKQLGQFRPVLDDLFRRARSSYEFLLDAGRRKTLVDAHEAQVREERERREQAAAAARAAARVAEEEQAEREREDQARRAQQEREQREERDRQRQRRLHDRALARRRKQAAEHAEQALREREIGRHGTAATLFRLAHEQDPSHPDYERQWRDSLATARRQRAEISFRHGREALAAGQVQEAARHLGQAAQAEPSLRNLTEAAVALSEVDPVQARGFAMAALEALMQAQARDRQLDERTAANVHQACARAFLAAGQLATAREQAERAHQLAPSKQTRALLNSIKLT